MTVEITLSVEGEPDDIRQFATNHGLDEFGDWVLDLPDEDYPDLRHLIKHGWADGLDAVGEQVRHALDEHPPDSADVASVAMDLERLVEGQDPDGTIILGDAGGADGDDGNEDDDEDEDEME